MCTKNNPSNRPKLVKLTITGFKLEKKLYLYATSAPTGKHRMVLYHHCPRPVPPPHHQQVSKRQDEQYGDSNGIL